MSVPFTVLDSEDDIPSARRGRRSAEVDEMVVAIRANPGKPVKFADQPEGRISTLRKYAGFKVRSVAAGPKRVDLYVTYTPDA